MDVIGPHDLDVVHTPQTPTPTTVQYGGLQYMYGHFNRWLFDNLLPLCLITLQRQSRTLGYYSPAKFAAMDDSTAKTDELALNPAHFRSRGMRDVCSTLVHEMVHLAQHHFGKPARSGYHDRKWAEAMKQIGLYPSNTGAPGGAETGYRMDHYIIEGGPFARAFEELARTTTIAWGDALSQDALSQQEDGPKRKPKRLKFTCPSCAFNALAVPAAAGRLACVPCGDLTMVAL